MTSRLASRIEKAEGVVRSRPLHLIVCKDAAEVGEAERFLGDRFGDLVFVATGVRRGLDKAQRHAEWLRQAKGNTCGPRAVRSESR
jgi:hypothetical protein